jgi:hypothetical protein
MYIAAPRCNDHTLELLKTTYSLLLTLLLTLLLKQQVRGHYTHACRLYQNITCKCPAACGRPCAFLSICTLIGKGSGT